jgi:hypothetical protein
MTSTYLRGTLGSVASLLAATLYQGNHDRKHKFWNIERDILHMQVLLDCCYIWMESSQWENWNDLFCRKASFLTAPHWQYRGVSQGMKQIYLYLWYPLFSKFVSDLCQVSCFLRVLRFSPIIKLTATI